MCINSNSSGSVVFRMCYNSSRPCRNNRIIVHMYCRWSCVAKKNLVINLASLLHFGEKFKPKFFLCD